MTTCDRCKDRILGTAAVAVSAGHQVYDLCAACADEVIDQLQRQTVLKRLTELEQTARDAEEVAATVSDSDEAES